MSLDINLVHIGVQSSSLQELRDFLAEWQKLRVKTCHGKPAYKATSEEWKQYFAGVRNLLSQVKSDKWFSKDNVEEVHIASSKNPYGDLGYWRVSYGISRDPNVNPILGTLYEAFPEAHSKLGIYVGANWPQARNVVTLKLAEVEKATEKFTEEKIVLQAIQETVDYVLSQPNPETYFLFWGA